MGHLPTHHTINKMMRLTLVCCLAAVAIAAPFNTELDDHWDTYKKSYNKVYDEMQEVIRRSIWEKNLRAIHEHNLLRDEGVHSFSVGINEYSDLTHEEYRSTLLGYKQSNATRQGALFMAPSNIQVPKKVDWRDEGKLVSLSEQNLVDCSKSYGNHGCEGGLMDFAFQYIKDNKGLDTEASYPYEAEDDTCRFRSSDVGATDVGYTDIPRGDEDALMKAIATVGPISVAIDAAHPSFQQYRSGVYVEPECSSMRLDHGVLAVGYGTHQGQDYWLIKNSWGESWGMDGYIMMARNMNNQCGVATQASYPLV